MHVDTSSRLRLGTRSNPLKQAHPRRGAALSHPLGEEPRRLLEDLFHGSLDQPVTGAKAQGAGPGQDSAVSRTAGRKHSASCVELTSDQRGNRRRAGRRFVERMLTVVATCRQQGRDVLEYLRSCFETAWCSQAIPFLFPVAQPKIKVA